MLDLRFIANDPDRVKDNLRLRRADDDSHADVDRLVALHSERQGLVSERDGLRAERNSKSKAIGGLFKEGRRDEAEALKAEVTAGNERIAVLEDRIREVEETQRQLAMRLPNLLDPEVPDGNSDEDNPEVSRWGTPRTFDFEPLPHVEVGERLGILDFERAAKISGARFGVLHGMGARLERALINFFLESHTRDHGYTEVMVPYIVNANTLEGTGQLPKFGHDMFKIHGELNGSDSYLIPTAEVPVTNLHADEILDIEGLPLQYACFTPCFRAEAGSAGRDVRGLMRMHQFHKVELVWVTTPERSAQDHEALLSHAQAMLEALELPYRTVLLCSGDVGFSAQKCYDLEVWIPSQNKYREVSSVSNFGDFQSRRMGLRYRPALEAGAKKRGKPEFAHTLNGSGLAVGRTLLAILENNQQSDGSVVVPEVLRDAVGTDILRPRDNASSAG